MILSHSTKMLSGTLSSSTDNDGTAADNVASAAVGLDPSSDADFVRDRDSNRKLVSTDHIFVGGSRAELITRTRPRATGR